MYGGGADKKLCRHFVFYGCLLFISDEEPVLFDILIKLEMEKLQVKKVAQPIKDPKKPRT